jgi:ferredoxin
MPTMPSSNHLARELALQAATKVPMNPTSLIEYQSRGRIAVIGGFEAMEFAPRLLGPLHPQVVLLEGAEEPGVPVVALAGRPIRIEGYLGAFNIHLGEEGKSNYECMPVDLILDLSPQPILTMPIKPPGYFSCATDEVSLSEALESLSQMTGVFEKPKFFDYDAEICAHGRSGVEGCNRCVEACPAQAITTLAESISVNPNLCQGGGVCASVCPTGAIRYHYPQPETTLEQLAALIKTYREQGGMDPVICFMSEADAPALDVLPDNVLPVLLEELASVGFEVWLAALCFGAASVYLLDCGSVPDMVSVPLKDQVQVAQSILEGFGYPGSVLSYITDVNDIARSNSLMPSIKPATYKTGNNKRQMAFFAIDHLYHQAVDPARILAMPDASPFGRIMVDQQACTLCMACTSVCPANAINAGGETPKLIFHEMNCVQCGICAKACPEQAISLEPRLLADSEQRLAAATLNEETPFLCISCGKPFATQSVINIMMAKLQGHWMYQSERSRQRLRMCEDCRVIDVMQDAEAMESTVTGRQIGPDVH